MAVQVTPRLLIGLLVCACAAWARAGAAAPLPECSRCIVVYGDSRTGHDVHRRIVAQIQKLAPVLVIHTGDLVARGTSAADWSAFATITAPLRNTTRFYPVLGNHDRGGEANFFALFPALKSRAYYTVEQAGILFIVLDDHAPLEPGSEQRRWLESTLDRTPRSARFVAVVLHGPLLSSGPHGGSALAGSLLPLLERRGVHLVLAGHDHDYERSLRNGVYHVTTGGGGAPLYDRQSPNPSSQRFARSHGYVALSTAEDHLGVEAFDEQAALLDRFEIRVGVPAGAGR